MLRAVLDANVYVSAVIRPEGPPGQIIERFLRRSAFVIVMSPAIVDEVRNALAYPKVQKPIRGDIDAPAWFDAIVLLADLIPGEFTVRGVSRDPDDDKYLAAAAEGRANVVVSGDPDLLAIKQYEEIRIVGPREFLGALA